MNKIAEQVLVASGNYPVFPAGQPVWVAPAGKKSPTLQVLPGQVVIYDPSTNLSLGPGATVETNPGIKIAVGVSKFGRGAADFLLGAAGETIYGCATDEVNVRAPKCGRPDIKDLLFSCTTAGQPYTVVVTAWDSDIRGQFDYNVPAEYVFTRTVNDSACTDCTSADVSRQLACELVDAMNGTKPAGWDVTKNGKYIEPTELPFTASRLFNSSTIYCLSNVASDGCEQCNLISRLHSIVIGEDEPIVFTNANLPGNVDVTAIGQLAGIVEQINTALDGNGTATLLASGAKCCPYSIEINTCLEDVVLNGWDPEEGEGGEPVALTPCGDATNPLVVPADAPTCRNCEVDEAGDLTYPAGIRIFGKEVEPGSGCYIPQPVRTYLGRQLEIYPKGGFENGTYRVVDVQDAENANNLGSQLIHIEYRQNVGGPGRHLDRPFNSMSGRFNLPIKGDRITELQTDPNKQYCHYVIEHTLPSSSTSYHGFKTAAKLRTRIFIPSADTTTITDVEAILNAYYTSAPCKKAVSLDCLD
jgi:hypothetical protein